MKILINTTLKMSWAIVLFLGSTISLTASETTIIGFDVSDFEIGNMLTWQTITEANNKEFIIERSADGNTYETIGTVDGIGTSVNKQDYSFLDISVDKGLTRYRLKQVNLDGTFQYSNVIKIDKRASNNFTITSMTSLEEGGIVEILLAVKRPSTISYRITKLNANIIYTASQTLKAGKNIVSVDLSEYEIGSYEIFIQGEKETESIVFKNNKKKNLRSFADFDDGKSNE
ncbi:MAG: hypothetical protein AB8G11_13990 [Saprospiraceae bacterium]